MLLKYFDGKLAALLVKYNQCNIKKTESEECVLSSSVMYAAQGGEGSDVHICEMDTRKGEVEVQFRINGDPNSVSYKLVRTKAGWRISDILYIESDNSKWSLVEVLSKKFH